MLMCIDRFNMREEYRNLGPAEDLEEVEDEDEDGNFENAVQHLISDDEESEEEDDAQGDEEEEGDKLRLPPLPTPRLVSKTNQRERFRSLEARVSARSTKGKQRARD
jgi:hypothetical protein